MSKSLRKQGFNNSVSSKFYQLKCLLQEKVDILVLTESKLDSSLSTNQFLDEGYSNLIETGLERNRNGGGIFLCIREDIPCKELKLHGHPHDIEEIFVEVNLRKTKWLLSATYHPLSQVAEDFFSEVDKGLEKYSQIFSKFLLIGDFNSDESEPVLAQFLQHYNAVNIIRENTYYKSNNNPIILVIIF